jgi:hypothetical protein
MGDGNEAARPRYMRPTLFSLDSEQVRDLLGPVETQYTMTTTGSSCLPLSTIGDTVQDNWQFNVPAPPNRVTIKVDIVTQDCSALSCSRQPAAGSGPLDPKFAVYEPGKIPAAGPFNGFFSPDCTADTGCPTKPANACIRCDDTACTLPASLNTCGTLVVNLTQKGDWTVAVAPQAPSIVPQSQGCYVITVTAEAGKSIGVLRLVNDDVAVTFVPPR